MRLIDADALMTDLGKWLKHTDPTHPPEDNAIPPMEDIIVSTLMTIEEQPTIEPQRMRGRWEYLDYGGVGNYHCTACRRICVNKGDYDFCPYCGCQMCGGEEDE